jgi:hypothetical protein
MKKLGLALLLLAALAVIGGLIWITVSQANTPVIVFIILGAVILGFLAILIGVIRDRVKQKKKENFKGVKY